jgi:large subunit ribosomal protein L29
LKAKDIRALEDAELKKQLDAAYQETFELRFKAATKQAKSHRDLPKARKNIARMKTITRERELGIR